jgi:DNA-binding transcriptional regulator YhcF (GntR family)
MYVCVDHETIRALARSIVLEREEPMDARLDHTSPIPLYHQLAESLRWRISTGELRPGDRLPALRGAAAELGVNLHTVRAAYAVLIQEGLLVSEGARGTRVVEASPETAWVPGELAELVKRLRDEARERFDIQPQELARLVVELPAQSLARTLSVVECSTAQCLDHARELEQRLGLSADPWSLEREGEPPPGVVVATYFHYADIMRRWPHRHGDLVFVAVHPDPRLGLELEGRFPETGTVLAFELDATRAANLAADLTTVLNGDRWRIEPLASVHPAEALDGDSPVCFSPRAWAELDEVARSSRSAVRVRYVIAQDSLEAIRHRLAIPG